MGVAPRTREMQRADPRTRRLALSYLVVTAIFGGGVLWSLRHFQEPLLAWFLADSLRAGFGVAALLLLVVVPQFLMAAWIWRYGGRVLHENRDPPEGARLVRDTPIYRGVDAQRRGRLCQMLAAFFLLAAAFTGWVLVMLWRLG